MLLEVLKRSFGFVACFGLIGIPKNVCLQCITTSIAVGSLCTYARIRYLK